MNFRFELPELVPAAGRFDTSMGAVELELAALVRALGPGRALALLRQAWTRERDIVTLSFSTLAGDLPTAIDSHRLNASIYGSRLSATRRDDSTAVA